MHCKKKYRKGGITPNNDTDPKERDYEAMADRSKKRDKENIKKTKELGSGKFKKAGKSDGGVGAYCAKVGSMRCEKGTLKMKAQGKRSGTSYRSSGKDMSDISKENAKKKQRILRGEGGGSEAYQKAARDITYDREAMREAVAKDRELLNSGKISNEEFKKRKAAHISKNKESRKKTSEQHKEDAAVQRASRGSDDSSLSTGRSRGRRGYRVKRGTDPEQLVKLKAKKPKLYKNGGTTPKVGSEEYKKQERKRKYDFDLFTRGKSEPTPAFSQQYSSNVPAWLMGERLKRDLKSMSKQSKKDEKNPPSEKELRKRITKRFVDRMDRKMEQTRKDMQTTVGKYSTKRPYGAGTYKRRASSERFWTPEYLMPSSNDVSKNKKFKTLGDQYRMYDDVRKGKTKAAKMARALVFPQFKGNK